MPGKRWMLQLGMYLLAALAPTSYSFAQSGIAILNSAYSETYFGIHYQYCAAGSNVLGATDYQRYVDGWEHVLNGAGLSYTVLGDSQITDSGLAPFRLLILANAVSISDDEGKAIQHWVRKGGSLIATFGSGYKDVVADPSQADGLALQEGGTNELHNLWGDPLSKAVTSQAIPGVGTVPYIVLNRLGTPPTQLASPTSPGLTDLFQGNLLPYGGLANILIHRPATQKDVFGILDIPANTVPNSEPAILVNSAAQGMAVYFAFAPEYLVALEFGLPATCPGQSTAIWQGRSEAGASLMLSTVQFLLGNQ